MRTAQYVPAHAALFIIRFRSFRVSTRAILNPNIGSLPLSEVNNGALKTVVAILVEAGLSPKTIDTYVGVMKTVVASAVNGLSAKVESPVCRHATCGRKMSRIRPAFLRR